MSFLRQIQPAFQKFQTTYTNGSNPTSGNGWASVTNGASSVKGSWVQLIAGASLADDVYAIELCLVDPTTQPTQDNSMLVDVGTDPAGGSGYTAVIPNLSCLMPRPHGNSAIWTTGARWFFPLFIKAGSSIGIRSQIAGSSGVIYLAGLRMWQKPWHPDVWRSGSYVDSLGANTANSHGVVLGKGSPNTQTFGAWTSLGTTAREAWWLQGGWCVENGLSGSLGGGGAIIQFAIGTQSAGKEMVVGYDGTSNKGGMSQLTPFDAYCGFIPAGSTIYARYQEDNTSTDNMYAVAHLLG